MKRELSDFDTRIANTLIDFKTFQAESGKSTNMTVQEIFARQLRAVKGLGVDNCAAVTRVFKTPFLLHMCHLQVSGDSKAAENLINSAKLELERCKKNFIRQNDDLPT